jgi:hypothetical protein
VGENIINDVLSLEIPIVPGMSRDEIDLRVEQEAVANMVVSDYAEGRVSFDDMLDVLEYCEVNIDEYVKLTLSNLVVIGAL